jgi:hypothetical protein
MGVVEVPMYSRLYQQTDIRMAISLEKEQARPVSFRGTVHTKNLLCAPRVSA